MCFTCLKNSYSYEPTVHTGILLTYPRVLANQFSKACAKTKQSHFAAVDSTRELTVALDSPSEAHRYRSIAHNRCRKANRAKDQRVQQKYDLPWQKTLKPMILQAGKKSNRRPVISSAKSEKACVLEFQRWKLRVRQPRRIDLPVRVKANSGSIVELRGLNDVISRLLIFPG